MEDQWMRFGARILLLAGVLLVMVVVLFGATRKFWRSASFSISDLDWSKRILFDVRGNFVTPIALRSINADGSDEIRHRLICEGKEVVLIGRMSARSADGRLVAFLLPVKAVRDQNLDWESGLRANAENYVQGEIFLFDLVDDSCRPTGVTADRLYEQHIAFSPDGRYLAYVFYGVRLYDLNTGEVTVLTEDPGSARIGTIVTGPLLWNRKGTALYVAISDVETRTATDGFPTSLYRVEMGKAEKEKVLQLADYFPLYKPFSDYVDWEWELPRPDDPLVYAVSPDEARVVVEEKGDLVIKHFSGGSDMLWERTTTSGPLGHALWVKWLPSGWIVMRVEPEAVGSSAGTLWISKGDVPGWKLERGFQAVSDLEGNEIAFNFEYFGDYYVPEGQPEPNGFIPNVLRFPKFQIGLYFKKRLQIRKFELGGYRSEGHRWDGIGIYDLETGRGAILSGRGKPTGTLWSWFW